MASSLDAFHCGVPPVHTHSGCSKCKKRAQLSRCGKCNIARYCSKECQLQDWNTHKLSCKDWRVPRDHATKATGNPDAWSEFATWYDWHQNTIGNAFLAHASSQGPGAEEYVLCIFLAYKYAHATSLAERKFDVEIVRFLNRNSADARFRPALQSILGARDKAIPAAHRAGLLRTCILFLSFSAKTERCLYTANFTFSAKELGAEVNASTSPELTLTKMLQEGRRLRVCCKTISETSDCCCGGWTHEEEHMAPLNHAHEEGPSETSNNLKPFANTIESQEDSTDKQVSLKSKDGKPKKKRPKKRKLQESDTIAPGSNPSDQSFPACKDEVLAMNRTSPAAHPDATPVVVEVYRDVETVDTVPTSVVDVEGPDTTYDRELASPSPAHNVAGKALMPDIQSVEYDAQIRALQKLFPSWSHGELHGMLIEAHGDVKPVAQGIREGKMQHWVPVRSKKAKRRAKHELLSKATPDISSITTHNAILSEVDKLTVHTEVVTNGARTRDLVSEEPAAIALVADLEPVVNPPAPIVQAADPRIPRPDSGTLSAIEERYHPTRSPTFDIGGLAQDVASSEPKSTVSKTTVTAAEGHIVPSSDTAVTLPGGFKAPSGLKYGHLSFGSIAPGRETSPPPSLSTVNHDSAALFSPTDEPSARSEDAVAAEKSCQQQSTHRETKQPLYLIPARRQQNNESALPQSGDAHTANPLSGINDRYAHLDPHESQPESIHYIYNKTYTAHNEAYGATPDPSLGESLHTPSPQPMYAPPVFVLAPIGADATRALEIATQELRDATRLLHDAAQNYYRATGGRGLEGGMQDELIGAAGNEADSEIPEPALETYTDDESPTQVRGRRRRVSTTDILATDAEMRVARPRAHSIAVEIRNHDTW